MAKDQKITVALTRKQTAPRNAAARSLREGQFQPKVEADPKAYKRKNKHKTDPVLEAKKQDGDGE
ncbi:hypothetical protein VW23_007265 [Devosia insulae DS-56]|uniref:Uncharacterized protein n=1 Tax=Devosia insulae DS-56 TaxID=1116389 RepID=A0A1E5XHE3_9HYPH|nr:hypothetical protein [Devosia insulae]OEO27904.1 hypothetical protein VW23_007265 [Devosia insulae DS-56]